MTVKLGLAPAIALQKHISGAAFFTGLMIYLEGIVALVRSWFPRAAADYRLALRLFGCLLHEHPTSARDVEVFMRENLPVVAVSVLAYGPRPLVVTP